MAEIAAPDGPSTPPPRLLVPVGTRVRVWVQSDGPGGGDWRFGEIIGGNLLDSGEQRSNVRLENNRGDRTDVPIYELRWEKDLDHRAPFAKRIRWQGGFHAVYVHESKTSRVMTTPTVWREESQPLVVGWSTPDKGMASIKKQDKESWEACYSVKTNDVLQTFLAKNLDRVRGWHEHLDPKVFQRDPISARIKQFQAPSALGDVKEKVDYDCEHSFVKLETCFQITYHGHTEHELNWPMAGTEDMESLGFGFEYHMPEMRQTPFK